MAPGGSPPYPEVDFESDTDDDQDDGDPLYEETNPDLEGINGGLKTPNPKGNRWQRPVIHHTSPKASKFRKTVEPVLVVHGWKTPQKIEPMSLIVLSIRLNCQAPNFRFQSVRIWLSFHEDNDNNNTGLSLPEVVAYAPFVSERRWNASNEQLEKANAITGRVGVEEKLKAEVEGTKETKRSYTREHFDRGSTDWMYDKDSLRKNGVMWYCEQNKLKDYGVQPEFHIAVLLKRKHAAGTNKAISFSGLFDMRAEAGFRHDFVDGTRRFFRLGKLEDEPIYYNPESDAQIGGVNNAGQKLRAKVGKADNLGSLISGPNGDWLTGLIGEEGDIPVAGLDPMKPKLA